MPEQRNDSYPIRTVHLARDVTWDLYGQPYTPAYRFLHKSGSYLCESTGQKDVQPVTVHTWAEAARIAQSIDASFIVNFNEKRVHGRVDQASGGVSWFVAVPFPHESIEVLNNAKADPYEPLADGSQPARRKQLSGAQKRKKYGAPPSYINRKRARRR